MADLVFKSIGTFHCSNTQPVDSPRQGSLGKASRGVVVLNDDLPVESLRDLTGFDRLWLIYSFHQNTTWKPLVRPPRGVEKRGVFATRSPYRPNGIGLSCVRVLSLNARKIECVEHDLLDQTPILDIKPYIVEADCFPQARQGWLSDLKSYKVEFSPLALEQTIWIENAIQKPLRQIIEQQLSVEPTNGSIKRVKAIEAGFSFHYRTWKIGFEVFNHQVRVLSVGSNYCLKDLLSQDDPFGDKETHIRFLECFP